MVDDPRHQQLLETFPALALNHVLGALRSTGGDATRAATLLRSLGATEAPPRPSERRRPQDPPSDEMISQLIFMGFEPREKALAALSRFENADAAVDWLLDSSEETVQAAIDEDERLAREAHEAETARTMAASAPVPTAVVALEGAPVDARRRSRHHQMITVGDGDDREACPVCGCAAASTCEACSLCAACVAAGVVESCPALFNGGPLHAHPLVLTRVPPRRAAGPRRCGLQFGGDDDDDECWRDQDEDRRMWYCEICAFYACPSCVKRAPPVDFRRASSSGGSAAGSTTSRLRSEAASPRRANVAAEVAFDAAAVERAAAARWEQRALLEPTEEYEIGGPAPTFFGEGGAGEDLGVAETARRRHQRLMTRPRRSHTMAARPQQRLLSKTAIETLVVFAGARETPHGHDGVWRPRGRSKKCSLVDDEDGPPCRHCTGLIDEPHWSCCGQLEEDAPGCARDAKLSDDDAFRVRSAAEVATAERILSKAEALGLALERDDRIKVYASIRNRDLALAGQLVMSAVQQQQRSSSTTTSTTTDEALAAAWSCCVCHDEIEDECYGNVVACLNNGHVLHASCAADLVLGGRECPTCRDPLFFAALDSKETQAALERYARGALLVGDVVRVTSDIAACEVAQLANPAHGGWHADMVAYCGEAGTVLATRRVDDVVVVDVQVSRSTLRLCASLLQVVRRARPYLADSVPAATPPPAATTTSSSSSVQQADTEMTSRFVDSHIALLRAELVAVRHARDDVRAALELNLLKEDEDKTTARAEVSALAATISPADIERAICLLDLSERWGHETDAAAARARSDVLESVRSGHVDTAARRVRQFNAALRVEAALWKDATEAGKLYRVAPNARLELRAGPAMGSPRTGYRLAPGTVFEAVREQLDAESVTWLRVGAAPGEDEDRVLLTRWRSVHTGRLRIRTAPSFDSVETGNFIQTGELITELERQDTWIRHDRGWTTITSADDEPSLERVEDVGERVVRPGLGPQGWVRTRVGGPGKPLCVARLHGTLRCYACGDDLAPPFASPKSKTPLAALRVAPNVGDVVLVAATLEPAIVRAVTTDAHDHVKRVTCAFRGTPDAYEFRLEDLVATEATDDELADFQGAPRSRRELVLMVGEAEARRVWSSKLRASPPRFASCVRGHVLHARCFQGLLIAGRRCPACDEPLWVAPVERRDLDDDPTNCHAHRGRDPSQQQQQQDQILADDDRQDDDEMSSGNVPRRALPTRVEGLDRELRMCPACCAVPLANPHCETLDGHNGQCPRCSRHLPNSETRLAEALAQARAQGRRIATAIPKCDRCNVPVFFNGCHECGLSFTRMRWDSLPLWDNEAKSRLDRAERDCKLMRQLADQVRDEAARLTHERTAVISYNKRKLADSHAVEGEKPAPPPPTILTVDPKKRRVVGCDETCARGHAGEGPCLVCARPWGEHSGHSCRRGEHRGARGSWPLRDVDFM